MCSGNGTIQCALGMGLAYELYEWDYPMCTGKGTIKRSLGMGQAYVPSEWG